MTIREEFVRNGVVILRGLIAPHTIAECQKEWEHFKQARAVGWNKVEVNIPHDGPIYALSVLRDIRAAGAEALNHVRETYNVRLVVKDQHSRDAVFLHQDCGYHVGSLEKLSAFVALSSVFPENGAMSYWLGTHRFGYLGDVGEINPAIHPGKPRIITPILEPGDVVLMHSATWHSSGPNTCGVDRVLADIIYQRDDDESREIDRTQPIFVRSRSSRLIALQARVDQLEAEHIPPDFRSVQ